MLKAVFLVPWHPYPLHCGGALRAFHLMRQLARRFQTRAIFPSDPQHSVAEIQTATGIDEPKLQILPVQVPSGKRSLLNRVSDRWTTFVQSRSLTEPTNSVTLAMLKALQQTITEFRPDVVVLSETETLLCAGMIRRLCPNARIVIDMHNVNHRLREQYVLREGGVPENDRQYRSLLAHESSLHQTVDHIFTCSQDDLEIFQALNQGQLSGTVVPNGVDTANSPYDESSDKSASKELIYCASLTTRANIDGLLWFHQEIWPLIRSQNPDLTLTVVGAGSDGEQVQSVTQDASIRFAGRVPELPPWYQSAGVSICPLRLGSGTRLKILEAMSFGNPVVSTRLGCEGISVTDGKDIVIRDDPQSFADGVLELVARRDLFDRIRQQARQFVQQNYDWDVVGQTAADAIQRLRDPAPQASLQEIP